MTRFVPGGDLYFAKYNWPQDCYIQCGEAGIVFARGHLKKAFDEPEKTIRQTLGIEDLPPFAYRTAFFEAFPQNPRTFIRGEGKTIEDAEDAAWRRYQQIVACSHPSWIVEDSGAGYCVDCGVRVSRMVEPQGKCACGHPIYLSEERCYQCQLLGPSEDDEMLLDVFLSRLRSAALWLLQQDIACPHCARTIREMHIVGPSEWGITPLRAKQHDLIRTQMQQRHPHPIYDLRNRFPYSVFFKCGCPELKLIGELTWNNGQLLEGDR